MTGVAILGSTGSIGLSTLDVVARHPDRYQVVALTANGNDSRLLEQCIRYRPQLAALADPAAAARLAVAVRAAGLPTEVVGGPAGLLAAATHPEAFAVMAAIVGAAGLEPSLAAARAGKRVLLANKEALVCAGEFFLDAVRAGGAELVPIDSEHNAIFQCLPAGPAGVAPRGVRRLLLTASGGPFLRTPSEQLAVVTPAQAVAHPNWSMGRKISVDSATLMNKGLELIEASLLFGLGADRVEVVVHPQSVVHSMVEYVDGSVLAQLGCPDMRTPIAHALAWPERMESGVKSLDIMAVGRLDFEAPDHGRFPCLGLAIAAARAGGTTPAALNAANEVAVAAFLDGRLNFGGIAAVIEQVLARFDSSPLDSLEAALAADARARAMTTELLAARGAAA